MSMLFPSADNSKKYQTQTESMFGSLFVHLDWLLLVAFSLLLLWLLFMLATSSNYLRRLVGSSRKLRASNGHNHNTGWRFNSSGSRATIDKELPVGGTFGSKICANYYGGSNGDSEHDMMQSCSQSSHYEDFALSQQQLQQQHQQRLIQQPVYFNNHSATLQRRPVKPTTSNENSLTMHKNQPRQQATVRDARAASQTSARREFHKHEPDLSSAHTMRDSNLRLRQPPPEDANLMGVPLVNGAHNSRINLDQQQNLARFSAATSKRPEQLHQVHSMNPNRVTGEHIYDDLVYSQMIL